MFDTIGEIKGPLLYCLRFEMILNSWLLSQKCHQRERISLRDGLRLPSNSALMIIRRQFLYVMTPEGSFYICISFSQNCRPSKKIFTNSQLFLTDPRDECKNGTNFKTNTFCTKQI